MITLGLLASLLSLSEAHENCSFSGNLEAGKTYYAYNPNFPSKYQGEHQCIWEMTSSHNVTLNCTIEIPKSINCNKDFLIIKSVDSKFRYCGKGTFVIERARRIEFSSVYYTNGGTFLCKIQTEAEQNVKDKYNYSRGWKNPTRIIGGRKTDVNEYPMIVGMVDSVSRTLYCDATIISEQYVVTAAHCLERKNISETDVVVGEHNTDTDKESKMYRINKCTIHPERKIGYNDIAVCQIDGRIEFNGEVGPVCLPFEHKNDSFIGSKVTLLGWKQTNTSDTKSNLLKVEDVCVISTQACKNENSNKQLTYNHMCTYTSKDVCQMVSGGPVLWQNPCTRNIVLVGIIGCGTGCVSHEPAINTRVGNYTDWIKSVTSDVKYCQGE